MLKRALQSSTIGVILIIITKKGLQKKETPARLEHTLSNCPQRVTPVVGLKLLWILTCLDILGFSSVRVSCAFRLLGLLVRSFVRTYLVFRLLGLLGLFVCYDFLGFSSVRTSWAFRLLGLLRLLQLLGLLGLFVCQDFWGFCTCCFAIVVATVDLQLLFAIVVTTVVCNCCCN